MSVLLSAALLLLSLGCGREDAACGAEGTHSESAADGSCSCEPGYTWADAGSSEDYSCVREPTQAAACPEAADCTGRQCGRDPVCGMSCGTCSDGTTCGGGGQPFICGRADCQPSSAACAAVGSCGLADDGCGGTVDCAGCPDGQSCGGAGEPNVCGCASESDAALCARLGKNCGTVLATDNCGMTRNVSCGSCGPSQYCGGGGLANVCGCTAESDAAFCSRFGKNCGALTGSDNCGVHREVASCGACAAPESCGGGGAANVCGEAICTPESNYVFCQRYGKDCGSFSATDNCGAERTASCGSCYGYESCGGGGVANVCACAPESDAAFCAQKGAACGSVSGYDSCGSYRSLASCGSCPSPQSCGGGGRANQCGCAPESDAAFCARLGASCGSLTAADNCGQARTVTSCGGYCTHPDSCGGGGQANVCGCTPQSDADLCSGYGGAVCGVRTVVDSCGDQRSVDCGGCTAPATCGGSGATNLCGIPMAGSWRWVIPKPSGEPLSAVAVVGSSDVWAVGALGTILHWNGSTLTAAASPTSADLSDVFAVSAADIWAVGKRGTILHYDGSAWSAAADTGAAGGETFASVWASGPADVWVIESQTAASDSLFHWDGVRWTRQPGSFLYSGAHLDALTGTSSTDVWAVGGPNPGYRWNGLEWTYGAGSVTLRGAHALAPNDVWAVGQASDYYGSSYPVVYHFDGSSWSGGRPAGINSSDWLGRVWAASSTERWVTASYSRSCVLHYTASLGSYGCVDVGFDAADVHGSAAANAWFIGWGGQISRWDGSAVARVSQSYPGAACTAVSGASASALFQACGTDILRVNAATGAVTTIPVSGLTAGDRLTAIWAASASDVWVGTGSGKLIRYDGSVTSLAASYPGSTFQVLWGRASNDIWAGTGAGSFLHYNGTSWSPVSSGTTDPIGGIWGAAANDVYATAGRGYYLHYDGTSWSRIPETMSPAFNPGMLHGSSATNIWARNNWFGGDVYRFDGAHWSAVGVPGTQLDDLWVAGENDVFLRDSGVVYHFNGWDFTPTTATKSGAFAIWGVGARDLFLFSTDGVLRYR